MWKRAIKGPSRFPHISIQEASNSNLHHIRDICIMIFINWSTLGENRVSTVVELVINFYTHDGFILYPLIPINNSFKSWKVTGLIFLSFYFLKNVIFFCLSIYLFCGFSILVISPEIDVRVILGIYGLVFSRLLSFENVNCCNSCSCCCLFWVCWKC